MLHGKASAACGGFSFCPAGRAHCAWGGRSHAFLTCLGEINSIGPAVGRDCLSPTNGRAKEVRPSRPVYTPRSGRPNRGPSKQVFVCGAASAVGPSGSTWILRLLDVEV